MEDPIAILSKGIAELDYLFQEGVVFTKEEEARLQYIAEQLTAIVEELEVKN